MVCGQVSSPGPVDSSSLKVGMTRRRPEWMPLEHGHRDGVPSCPDLRAVLHSELCKMKLGALITERKKISSIRTKLFYGKHRDFIIDSPFLAIFTLHSVPKAFFLGFHLLAIRLNICCAQR